MRIKKRLDIIEHNLKLVQKILEGFWELLQLMEGERDD